ncbi:MAG TPA: hypothetical protein VHO90_19740 [Bacteroidales bacterium]|nr:hypothetical protein [Bacteroidales bacterium]
MTKTIEIRWFFKGIVSNDVLQFFKDRKVIFQEEQPRTDWYMLNLGKTASIKVRNGNLEVKQLLESIDNALSAFGVEGNAEMWSKYSLALKEEGESRTIIQGQDPHWIEVAKKRSVAKYEVKSDRMVFAIPADSFPGEGCSLEICFIKARKLDFWTLCFEASGSEDKIRNNLEAVVRLLFNNSRLPLLNTGNSYGYPEFLAKISLL